MLKILVALSLNEKYNSLVSYALWLATQVDKDASVGLLTVQDYSLTPPSYLMPYLQKERERFASILDKISNEIRSQGVESSYTVASGRLIDTFKKAVCNFNIDILVLGYKQHLLRMSSSQSMIRSINIPMLVCRGQKADIVNCLDDIKIQTVICLTDFSENSIRAFNLLKTLLKKNKDNVKVIILNVISSIRVEDIFKNAKSLELQKHEYCENLKKEGLQHLMEFESEGFSLEYICEIGIPYKTINDIARQKNADLIFMGAKGIAQSSEFRIGSLTESILKTSPCPVVVVT